MSKIMYIFSIYRVRRVDFYVQITLKGKNLLDVPWYISVHPKTPMISIDIGYMSIYKNTRKISKCTVFGGVPGMFQC